MVIKGSVVFWQRMHIAYAVCAGFLSILFLLSLFPIVDSIEEADAAPVPSTTTLAMTTPSVSLDLSVSDADGTFAYNTSDFTVASNNFTGYTLSIRAKEDNANNSKLISGNNVLNSIESATADDTGFNIGDWGYKPSKLDSVVNTDYLPSPTYTGSTLDVTNAANSTANTYSIALAAKADYTIANGAYSNTFILSAVGNPVNYTITYDKNTEDTVTNMPATQVGALGDNDIVISANTPARSGYSFLGWCAGTVTNIGGTDSCDTAVLAPGVIYPTSMQTNNDVTLKAIWYVSFAGAYAEAGKTTVNIGGNNYYKMQDMTTDICGTVSIGQEAKLVDTRDNTIYNVGKIKDGRCWLLDNLALDLTDSTVKANLTSTTTNASDTLLGYLKNGGGTKYDYATAGVANWGTTSSSSFAPLIYTANKDTVNTTYNSGDDPMKEQAIAGNWKSGIYYNYCAASAGSNCSYTDVFHDASGDICPAGWHMPTGEATTGEYATMTKSITGITGTITGMSYVEKVRNTLHLPMSGYYQSYSSGFKYDRGTFWASTSAVSSSSTSVANDFRVFGNSSVYPTAIQNRNIGNSVRCIADRRFNISYDANDGTGTTTSQTVEKVYITVADNDFTRGGYGFDHWNTKADGTGTSYYPGDMKTFSGDTTLYAQWEQSFDSAFNAAGKTKVNNYYKMQDMTSDICSNIAIGQTSSLIDTRDNTVYNVGKLKDGRCWLLDNLSLDLTDSNVKNNLTSATTNASDTVLGYLKNGGGTKYDYATAGVANWGTTSSSYQKPLIYTANKDTVNTTYNSGDDPMKEQAIAGNWKSGIYYNYCAATAGSDCVDSNYDNAASGDICPAGWHMPTGGANDGEYGAMTKGVTGIPGAITVSGMTSHIEKVRNTLHLPMTGYYRSYSNGFAYNRGVFWASTNNGTTSQYANELRVFGNTSFYVAVNASRSFGYPVRCIADRRFTISYDANGGSGTTSSQTVEKAYVTVANNNFTRSGYGFDHWNTKADGTGVSYYPGDTKAFGGNTTLYAQWKQDFDSAFNAAGKSKLNNYYKMQDMTSDTCSNIAIGQTSLLIDSRDNTVYNVGKLKDGKCWLLDNLKLDLTNSSVQNNLTTATTNVTDSTALTRLKSGGGTASDKYPITAIANFTAGSGGIYSQPLIKKDSSDVVPTDSMSTAGQWKTGYFYNFCAASAGTYCWGNGNSYAGGPSSDPNTGSDYDIDGDICPSGWSLPVSSKTTNNGNVSKLWIAYGVKNPSSVRNALHIPLSGFFDTQTIQYQHTYGAHYTASYSDETVMLADFFGENEVSSVVEADRGAGFSVRCVSK